MFKHMVAALTNCRKSVNKWAYFLLLFYASLALQKLLFIVCSLNDLSLIETL